MPGKSGAGHLSRVLPRSTTNDAMILQPRITGTVIGSLQGLPGNGRRISFRILHVYEFRTT